MQLGLNLINEERILELVRDFEEEKELPEAEILERGELKEEKGEEQKILELLIREIEEKEHESRLSVKKEDAAEHGSADKKEDTLKGIIKRINKRFSIKTKKRERALIKTKDYPDPELLKNNYGLNLHELFSYLRTRSATDVYKDFYNTGQPDKIYNFVDEPLSYAKLQKIQLMTKVARYAGYMGETEYCGHEMLDADTKEKWHLIRNITHVFILTMLRYDVALQ